MKKFDCRLEAFGVTREPSLAVCRRQARIWGAAALLLWVALWAVMITGFPQDASSFFVVVAAVIVVTAPWCSLETAWWGWKTKSWEGLVWLAVGVLGFLHLPILAGVFEINASAWSLRL